MVGATSVTIVDDPSNPRRNPARKSWTVATAVDFVLRMKKNELPLATEQRMVSCEQLGSVRSAFPEYRNITSNVNGAELGDRVIVAVMESGAVRATRRVRFEQNSNSLLRKLVSWVQRAERSGGLPVCRTIVQRWWLASRYPAPECLLGTKRILSALVWRNKPC